MKVAPPALICLPYRRVLSHAATQAPRFMTSPQKLAELLLIGLLFASSGEIPASSTFGIIGRYSRDLFKRSSAESLNARDDMAIPRPGRKLWCRVAVAIDCANNKNGKAMEMRSHHALFEKFPLDGEVTLAGEKLTTPYHLYDGTMTRVGGTARWSGSIATAFQGTPGADAG